MRPTGRGTAPRCGTRPRPARRGATPSRRANGSWRCRPRSARRRRSRIARAFAGQLVERYGVAADVAIHAPHREGDQRNHHAHVLTTTRRLEPDGFTAKTRVLDVAKTGGVEIEEMRGIWAGLQNDALERAGEVERVDHRSLETRRDAALSRGDGLGGRGAGPRPGGEAGTGGERDRAARDAGRRARGAGVRAGHRARGRGPCRPPGAGGVRGDARAAGAGAGDLRARARGGAGPRQRRAGGAQGGGGQGPERRARAGRVPGAAGAHRRAGRAVEPEGDAAEASGAGRGRERLREALGREREAEGADGIGGEREGGRPSIRERLGEVLNRPRERPAREAGREKERDDGIERERGRDLGEDYGL